MNKTYSMKQSEVDKKWIHIDAESAILGRVSALIAKHLMGKHLAKYTPNMDCGDYVVVTNAEKVELTGNKLSQEKFYWHTGYPGGIRSRTHETTLERCPEKLLYKAVERMLPKNKLRKKLMHHLRIFIGSEHTHSAQRPTTVNISDLNNKNLRRAPK